MPYEILTAPLPTLVDAMRSPRNLELLEVMGKLEPGQAAVFPTEQWRAQPGRSLCSAIGRAAGRIQRSHYPDRVYRCSATQDGRIQCERTA